MHPSRQHRHFLHISGTPEECRMEAARHADDFAFDPALARSVHPCAN